MAVKGRLGSAKIITRGEGWAQGVATGQGAGRTPSVQAEAFEFADQGAAGDAQGAGGLGLVATRCRQSPNQLFPFSPLPLGTMRLDHADRPPRFAAQGRRGFRSRPGLPVFREVVQRVAGSFVLLELFRGGPRRG